VRHPGEPVDEDVRRARIRDLENRQLDAVRRHEREAVAELVAMRSGLAELAIQQRRIERSLRERGYLLGHA
jgi:hypothetical protein